MKAFLMALCLTSTALAWGGQDLSFKDQVKVKKVVMAPFLLQNLTHLFSDFYFDDFMLAKKSKKASWSDDLRSRMKGQVGISKI